MYHLMQNSYICQFLASRFLYSTVNSLKRGFHNLSLGGYDGILVLRLLLWEQTSNLKKTLQRFTDNVMGGVLNVIYIYTRVWGTDVMTGIVFCKENAKCWSILAPFCVLFSKENCEILAQFGQFWRFCRKFMHCLA